MSTVQELLNEKMKLKQSLCKQATADVEREIDELREQVRREAADKAKAHEPEWQRIAAMIGEIARLAALAGMIYKYDMRFAVATHIESIQYRDSRSDDEWDSMTFAFADWNTKAPKVDRIELALDRARRDYARLAAGDDEGYEDREEATYQELQKITL